MASHSPSNLLRTILRKTPYRHQSAQRAPPQTRTHSSTPKHAPEPAKPNSHEQPVNITIPGPSWLWTQVQPALAPFRAYSRIQSRRPYTTQLVSSMVIYFVGDLSAQGIQRPTSTSSPPQTFAQRYDPQRSLRAVIIGGLFSIPSYTWFLWLGRHFNYPSRLLSVTAKVVFAQVVFTPAINSYFFGMQSLLSGDGFADGGGVQGGLRAAWERIRTTVPVSWYNSCKVWPAVTAFSFTFVQPQHRSVFAGVVAIGWQTYLSLLNQRAVEREMAAKGGEG